MNDELRQLKPYPMIELARRKAALIEQGVDVLDFGTGDPVEPTAPAIRNSLLSAVPEISQYPSINGTSALRESFSTWFEQRFGIKLDADHEVLPTRGSKEAMFHLPLVFVDPSSIRDTVVFPVPGYPVMSIGAMYAHAKSYPVALTANNNYLMSPENVPSGVLDRAALVWINYPHNPTGQDLPDDLWRAWVAARDEHGFLLCSDECYTEIYFDRKPRSVLEFGREGCLAFHSLSKRSGMTGYRSGMLAGDASALATYRRFRAAMGQAATVWVSRASATAWSDETHVESRRNVFREKRTVMLEGFEQLGLKVYPTTSTFYMWVETPEGVGDQAFCNTLLERGIVASPGTFFGPGNDGFVRFALVPSVDACREAIQRLAKG